MANVKRRLKAPKSAPKNETKKKRPNLRSAKALKSVRAVIDIETVDNDRNEVNSTVAKKIVNDDTIFLTPDEKVKYLLQNGHKLKKHFVLKPPEPGMSKQPKLNNPKSDPQAPKYHAYHTIKTKSGRLTKKKFKYLKYMDSILKVEFGMVPSTEDKELENVKSSRTKVNNNNYIDITNQNNKTTDLHKDRDQVLQKTARSNKFSKQRKTKAAVDVSPAPKKVISALKKVSDKSKHIRKRRNLLVRFADDIKPAQIQDKKIQEPKQNTTITKKIALANGIVLSVPLYECDYCQKKFTRKHSLVRHIYLHLGRQPHSCPVCPKKFRILKNMKNHIDRDHCVDTVDESTETYSCSICDKPFLTEENLESHKTSHIKGENTFKCIYCDKKFSYQLLLVQHEKIHLVTGKYQCTLCDVKYNSRDKLYVHVKSHLKLTDYICQYCGREFLRANSMKRHVQTMHGGHTIQCPVCNKKLKGHLTEHMRTHDKERPHKCPVCGKHFAQSTQMKVHHRAHTGYRPYICRICERPFSHSNALMLHLRRHTGEKPFPCAECPMSFSQLPHMKSHMFKIHGKKQPYKCLKCDDYFKLKKDLLFHKKTCAGTGFDSDIYGDKKIYGDSQEEDSEIVPVESTMTLSRMRFLLALLLTMIASKEKLKYLGFNKRLVDDLLIESLEAMDQIPCRDETISPLLRLRTNIEKLLKGTVPKEQMEKFRKEKKSTEELLELLTSEKEKLLQLRLKCEILVSNANIMQYAQTTTEVRLSLTLHNENS